MAKLNVLPIVGKKYHFFDDGKSSPSRHYIATVEEVITFQEARARYPKYIRDNENLRLLTEIWQIEVENSPWLYATETDYFIRCSIPKYDDDSIWFVRTKDGGWFSMDVSNGWQSGRLDVSGEIYKEVKEMFDSDHYDGYYDELSGTEKI